MSGSAPLQSTASPIYPVTIDTLPRGTEGSKVLPVTINWLTVFNTLTLGGGGLPTRLVAALNLLSQYQTGQFTTVQAVYIDNLSCMYPVVVTSLETGQRIKVNPLTAGMYPLFASIAPSFTITLEFFQLPNYEQAYGGNNLGTTIVTFLNTPQRFLESKYNGTPLTYVGSPSINVALTNIPLTDNAGGGIGNGMGPIDGNTLKRINMLTWTAFPNAAFTSVATIEFDLIEVGLLGTFTRYFQRWAQPTGQITAPVGVSNNIIFPGGLIQIDPTSTFNVQFSGIPPASTWGFRIVIQYDQLTFG